MNEKLGFKGVKVLIELGFKRFGFVEEGCPRFRKNEWPRTTVRGLCC